MLSFPLGPKQNLCDFLEGHPDFTISLVICAFLLRKVTHLQGESFLSDGEMLASFEGPGEVAS